MITTEVQFHDFWDWLKDSDGYKNNFSYDGAKALFEYLEQYSEDTGDTVEFDPVAWCVEFSEYENLREVKENYNNIKTMQDLEDHTTVIEADNGHLIIADF